MTMFREALIWILLLVFNLINTFLVLIGKIQLFKAPLWSTWLLWGIVTIIIISVLLFRKYLQKKESLTNINSDINKEFKEGEFFVQMPLYIIENQSNVIYGNETITYKPVFDNMLHKIMSTFGVQTKYSLHMNSRNNSVKVIRKNIAANRHQYTIYLNNEEVGTLEMKKFFKSGGKQQIPYTLNYKSELFDVSNPFFSNETRITSGNENLFTAKRSFLDISKSKRTKKHGEKHNIQILSTKLKKEILIAVYLQCIINKQTQ
ncbi:hypothetical protein E2558_07860 [Staphylococcus pragensis]|uniref:Uncharacterized protein n=1 Tax=Staphylococcus pragensis TaxID=1611836 RepID=A0A4Z1B6V7_9STAP|nr:hypothetical protein [Staphylococcus pragensis]RTX92034.1 hypothetical protein CD154_01540 [Staphylococcus carnosus]TGN26886.1 hypothetical protein E2558_07860 [Staphylococcus pragensis]GGG93632.1 hypothetical protein GCM10007342_15760 [Staphylococcus pragensis]